jgi:hypothetical protein
MVATLPRSLTLVPSILAGLLPTLDRVLRDVTRFVVVKPCSSRWWKRGFGPGAGCGAGEEARPSRLCVVVSFGKSGRTWLRVMLSRFYQLRHGLAERHLLNFDNLHLRNRAIPRIVFTHDNHTKDYTGHAGSSAQAASA